ncbi:MAG TPA: gamma-glutamylcyclotransferase family protein [Sphaerochaeta sp.]|nr:gamma-glutamylcyclotransferase family protein [Sphaerochaeta sp.]
MKKIYLAYGSNTNLTQMGHRCPGAAVIGSAVLRDHRLTFKGRHGSGVATIEEEQGSDIPALLWEITEQCERALDRYEGYPYLYRKDTLTVELDGEEVEAMAYIMNEGPTPALPGAVYYHTILEGYLDCGFDEDVLNKAVKHIAGAYHE